MKVGDLVRWAPEGIDDSAWEKWVGVVVSMPKETPQRARVLWNKEGALVTLSFKRDMEVVNESRRFNSR